jgi:DNA-binding transcriptional LysR family regulator
LRVNSPEAVREAMGAGRGVGHGPRWLFEAGLQDGSLRRRFEDYAAPPVPIQVLYAANRLLPRRAIVSMDFIAPVFARVSALNAGAATAPKR